MQKPAVFLACLALFAAAPPAGAREVQAHGLVFENWICDTFFGGHRPDYTAKWDIPGELNRARGGYPVNPKAIKYGTSVDMGDALRQFDIDEPFWLVIGYWEQRGAKKYFVNIFAQVVRPETWRQLWAPVTRADLEKLDALIKDRSIDYKAARKLAQKMKNAPPFSEAKIVVHPKIDSKGQRRLQCSIRFRDVFEVLGGGIEPTKSDTPKLWGAVFPNPVASHPREFAPAPAAGR